MFTTLPVSRPRSERSLMQALASLTFHAGLIMGAVHVTQGAAAMVERSLADTSAIYVQTAVPPPRPAAATPSGALSAEPTPTIATIAPPADIPTDIPPVVLGQAVSGNPFTGSGTAAGVDHVGTAFGQPGGDAPAPRDFTHAEVDVPVRYLGGGEPTYPATLKRAGISGVVLLQFVVDTAGMVEPASLKALPGSSAGFESAARDGILRARFAPATIRGRAVRQLVQQRVVFEVGR